MKSPFGVATLLTLALGSAALGGQTPDPSEAQAPAPQAKSDLAEAQTASSSHTISVSGVRIVRLSEIKGEAQLDRNTGHGFEPAFANLPIIQHAKLRTTEGVAEVEFEDNSSLRLTPNTVVDFPVLGRTSSGATLSTIHVLKGTVYISLTNTRSKTSPNQFTVTFGAQDGNQTLSLAPASHIELALGSPQTRLAVFEGSVDVQHGADTVTVAKKKQLTFDPGNPTAPIFISKVEKGPFDEWDKNQADYHKNYANAAFGLGSAYGTSDLNYYGSFANLPGCGNAWRPYFASAAWSPFANGTWALYPGVGYSWVSPYPWGWTPFHYGSWQQCGAAGWGWQPGGQWVGLQNVGFQNAARQGSSGLTNIHPKPPTPTPTSPTLIPVNTRPLSISRVAAGDTFVFSKDSAGLGVPRQTFGRLNSASQDVARHGASITPIVTAQSPASNGTNASGMGARNTSNGQLNPSARSNALVNNVRPANTPYNSPSNSGMSSPSGNWGGSSRSSAPTSAPAPSAPSGPASSGASPSASRH